MVASLQAMPWPLIGSSGGRKSIDCQSTKVDCLQCFYHLNSCGISSERTEEGCVSSCSGFYQSREDQVLHYRVSQGSLEEWYKSAAHTAHSINQRSGRSVKHTCPLTHPPWNLGCSNQSQIIPTWSLDDKPLLVVWRKNKWEKVCKRVSGRFIPSSVNHCLYTDTHEAGPRGQPQRLSELCSSSHRGFVHCLTV